jgi:nucleotide-binding universal stress UspA family protein
MKILVGYDGSNCAKDALHLSLVHAKAFGGQVEIVQSLPGGSATEAAQIKTAEEDLLFAKNACEEQGIPCQTHLLVRGMTPGEDLVKFAEDNQIDELIIGVKRRSKVGKLLFGSNAQYAILNAPCPVVTVK